MRQDVYRHHHHVYVYIETETMIPKRQASSGSSLFIDPAETHPRLCGLWKEDELCFSRSTVPSTYLACTTIAAAATLVLLGLVFKPNCGKYLCA